MFSETETGHLQKKKKLKQELFFKILNYAM